MLFSDSKISKEYHAIVRGYTPDRLEIDYPLTNDRGKTQEAFTLLETIAQTEINLPAGKHLTSRYSFVRLIPDTGRMHQLRKHMSHIFHPIIGDRPHGCNKQNKLFLETFNFTEMLLHARSASFLHPISDKRLTFTANYSHEFLRIYQALAFTQPLEL